MIKKYQERCDTNKVELEPRFKEVNSAAEMFWVLDGIMRLRKNAVLKMVSNQ